MKQVYICGDSFSVTDPEYGPCWVDILQEKLKDTATLIPLSRVCASNLLISLQVDKAITAADFIICHLTSSTREEAQLKRQTIEKDLFYRFKQNELTVYSIHSLTRTMPQFNKEQLAIVKTYQSEFFDLELSIYKNQCIIENILQKLKNSKIPFLFDQGGFEHPSMGATCKYFNNFDQYRSSINLWDYSATRDYRPYYHIRDSSTHQIIADYYFNQIQLIL